MDATWIKEVEESMGAEVGEEEIIKRVGVSVEEVKQKRNETGAEQEGIKYATSVEEVNCSTRANCRGIRKHH